MGLHLVLEKYRELCTQKILPWACQTGVFKSSMRCRFSTSICKSVRIQFIISGGDAPSVLDPMKIGSNKPTISPFWVVCSSRFLIEWALPKSSLNNDAHNPPMLHFCTIATNFRIFINPYNTLLYSSPGELIHSKDALALQLKRRRIWSHRIWLDRICLNRI